MTCTEIDRLICNRRCWTCPYFADRPKTDVVAVALINWFYGNDASREDNMDFVKWTNVVDRLPPLGAGKVVVYTKDQEFDGRQFFTMEADELYQDDDGLSEVVPFARFVTHWALLGDPERCKCNGWVNLCDCHITEALNEGDGTYRP